MVEPREETTFVAVSGLKFPTGSREYLINLVRDIVVAEKAKFVVVAGHAIDGRHLEQLLKQDLKSTSKEGREDYTKDFVDSSVSGLSEFLPKIPDTNWHFVVAEKVFDKPIGAKALEELRRKRDDVRILGRQADGTYDAEVKVPVHVSGVNEIRVIVPRKTPWFYRIITSLMQRLITSFVSRTNSPQPGLILVGGTGTEAYLPFYEGVPCISVPALYKIDEQNSVENMVGCVVVKISSINGHARITRKTYDFRTVVANELELTIPQDATKAEKAILGALKNSSASIGTLVHRLNSAKNGKRKKVDEEQLKKVLGKLMERGIIVRHKESNHYGINEARVRGIKVTLEDLLRDTRVFTYAGTACFHGGALKTLYHTALKYLPGRIWKADAWIEIGDETQGLAHQYEYNGEVLPITNGTDKQEILTASIRSRNILDIFKMRLKELAGKKLPHHELLKKCLIKYVFELGNHPSWIFHNKNALVLEMFERVLKGKLIEGIMEICDKEGIHPSYAIVKQVVDERIVRVGESQLVNIDGVMVGIKHPWKGRTLSKSHRIQDVVDFSWRAFQTFSKKAAKSVKGFVLVFVANFHEAAAVHVAKFGRTILGVMVGAYLKDTSFEKTKDKVVDFGHTIATVCLNNEDRLVYSEVEFDNYIHPDDERIVLADRVKTSDVNALCAYLTEIFDLPWR